MSVSRLCEEAVKLCYLICESRERRSLNRERSAGLYNLVNCLDILHGSLNLISIIALKDGTVNNILSLCLEFCVLSLKIILSKTGLETT